MRLYKLIFVSLCALFFLLSCSGVNKRPSPPGDVLNEKQMEDIIFDLHKVDGIMTSGVIPQQALYPDSVMYHSVFQKHHTSSQHFQKSVMYYTQNDMKGFKLIYSNVVERLNREKAELMGWN